MILDITLFYFSLIGTIVFAISGLLAASSKGLDLFGAIVIATVTAVGGGTLRDLIIGQPVFWVSQPIYVYVVLFSTFVLFLYTRLKPIPMTPLLYFDAFGLATFTVLGTQKALDLGIDESIAIMTGVMSGVFGGVIRDVLVGEVPLIFRKTIYATASFIGASLYVILLNINITEEIVLVISILVIFVSRVFAIIYNIKLPLFQITYHNK